MMKWLWTSLALAVFSTVAMGQQIKFDGRLQYGPGRACAEYRSAGWRGEPVLTDASGRFSIQLSSKLRDGERVVMAVDKKNWLINQPLDGEWKLPTIGSQNLD